MLEWRDPLPAEEGAVRDRKVEDSGHRAPATLIAEIQAAGAGGL